MKRAPMAVVVTMLAASRTSGRTRFWAKRRRVAAVTVG